MTASCLCLILRLRMSLYLCFLQSINLYWLLQEHKCLSQSIICCIKNRKNVFDHKVKRLGGKQPRGFPVSHLLLDRLCLRFSACAYALVKSSLSVTEIRQSVAEQNNSYPDDWHYIWPYFCLDLRLWPKGLKGMYEIDMIELLFLLLLFFFFAKAGGLFGLISSTVSLPDVLYNKSLMSEFLSHPPSLSFSFFSFPFLLAQGSAVPIH